MYCRLASAIVTSRKLQYRDYPVVREGLFQSQENKSLRHLTKLCNVLRYSAISISYSRFHPTLTIAAECSLRTGRWTSPDVHRECQLSVSSPRILDRASILPESDVQRTPQYLMVDIRRWKSRDQSMSCIDGIRIYEQLSRCSLS